TVACPAQNTGKNVRVPVDHIGLGVPALCDQADVLRHRRMGRARVLAIDDLMKIFGISNVGRFQLTTFLSEYYRANSSQRRYRQKITRKHLVGQYEVSFREISLTALIGVA